MPGTIEIILPKDKKKRKERLEELFKDYVKNSKRYLTKDINSLTKKDFLKLKKECFMDHYSLILEKDCTPHCFLDFFRSYPKIMDELNLTKDLLGNYEKNDDGDYVFSTKESKETLIKIFKKMSEHLIMNYDMDASKGYTLMFSIIPFCEFALKHDLDIIISP